MAQVVLYVDGEYMGQKGMHAPKKNTGTAAWAKDVLKLWVRELKADGRGFENLRYDRITHQSVNEREIRFLWMVRDIPIAVIIDRQANALCI